MTSRNGWLTSASRIDEIVFRTLEKERDLRQQSAAEVKTDVTGAANSPAAALPLPALTAARWLGAGKRPRGSSPVSIS